MMGERFQLGRFSVTRVEESYGPGMLPHSLLPDCTPKHLTQYERWLMPHYLHPESGRLQSSVHSWLIRSDKVTVLVDTCGGNCKKRPGMPRYHMLDTPWLSNLERAGAQPRDIDYVFCTHLHLDHCGWNTQLVDGSWKPTFPNARYVFARKELEYLQGDSSSFQDGVFADSVLPLLEACQTLALGPEVYELAPGITIEPAPGHSPGHCMLSLREGSTELGLFVGDAIHHPLQILHPQWSSSFCDAPGVAAQTRHSLLRRAWQHNALLLPAHFGWPHATGISLRADAFWPDFDQAIKCLQMN
jgi:glyoxylase-like metal-dependent hydrolase (beta-lactamase superfamily II)